LFTITVRPWRRTTVDPGFFFNDLSEVLTFIVSSSSRKETARGGSVFRLTQ
jgi:hypothetical protein